ncbi:head-tail connector protein [Atlantibacter subterraneus]|uniref:head-tail connector protein n=1 Tax=Atlantibacter subterraneus TaxID=255519 RepID=UPI0029647C9C|nr:head-tail connector protein [Atlantibacter subterranea]MDW2745141.1 head-tail connector protein [Atlantibacter subterranea]
MEISAEQMTLIKTHLRVDGNTEDALIAAYTAAAVDYVEKFCDGALVESLTPVSEDTEPPREVLFTSGIWAAMLLLIGHWYANREAVNVGNITSELPLGVEALLMQHRRWH